MKSSSLLLVAAITLTAVAGLTLQTEPTSQPQPQPEPEPEPEPKPSAEPESSSEPESTPEGEAEPESTPEGEAEPGSDSPPSYAEPEPEWDVAKELWGSAWEGHVYFFGASFGLVALYSLFSIIRLYKRKHLLSQKYFISLNLLIFLMGVDRCCYLLIDAYNSNSKMPSIVAYTLYTLFLPCVTSAFCLLFLSLLAATRMRFISPSIQKTKVILVVIIAHFTLAIVADVLTVLHLNASVILFLCQLFYITWGLFLFVGFMYIFGRLYKAALDRQLQMNKYALRRVGSSNKQSYKPERHKLTLSLGTIVTLISSILGLLTVIVLIYGMVDVYGVFEQDKVLEPWRWWGYHTAFRTLELMICITVSYVATQPFRYSSPTKRDSYESSRCRGFSNLFFLCAPCMSWCQRERSHADVEWSQLRSDVDSTILKRAESGKGDQPPESPTNPDSLSVSNVTGKDTNAVTLKVDDKLPEENKFQNEGVMELDNLPSVQSRQEKTTPVKCNNSVAACSDNSQMQASHPEGNTAYSSCTMRGSGLSLDTVSQMSPELESGTEDEMSGLLVDV